MSPLIAYAKKEKHAELLEAANVIRANHRRTANDLEAATAELRLLESRADRLAEGERAAVLARATDRVQRARAAYQSGRRSMLNLINRFQLKVGDSQPTTTTERAVKAIEAIGSDEALLFYTFVEDRLVLLSKQAGKGTSDKAIKSTPLRWPDGRPVTGESLDRAIQRYLQSMVIEGRAARSIGREKPVQRRQNANLGYDLFRALIPRDAWASLRKAKRVLVVPGGGMHRLPMEALIVAPPGSDDAPAAERRYWLDEGPPIVYGPSLRVMLRERLRQPDAKPNEEPAQNPKLASKGPIKVVVLADPKFQAEAKNDAEAAGEAKAQSEAEAPNHADGKKPRNDEDSKERPRLQRRFGLKPLPGTRREAKSIYRAWTGHEWQDPERQDPTQPKENGKAATTPAKRSDVKVTMLLGEEARAGALRDAADGAVVLHLATHGIAESGPKALYSGLALAAPKQGDSDDPGILTLGAILDRWRGRLRNTDLVVLSACDSRGVDDAGRNVRQGEGVFGLPWGFLYAGSRSVIASQWSVDDESTAVLMATLYERIGKAYRGGEPPALANTFVAVRKKLRATYPEPYFWAPFVLIGSPD